MGYPLTSFLVTGFSNNDRCVSRKNFPSTSKSASSAKLFDVRTRVARFGIEFGSVDCMELTRFLANNNVCSLGDSGKFPKRVTSLSVKSIASWSYTIPAQPRSFFSRRTSIEEVGKTNPGNAQIFNRGYFVACKPRL